MKYIAAYMLLTLGGNTEPKAEDITKLLKAGGIECDESRINALLKELEGKDINQLIAEGSTKLASVPSGGSAAAAPAAGAAGGGAAAPAAEAKAEEKEESDEDMGFGLFD